MLPARLHDPTEYVSTFSIELIGHLDVNIWYHFKC